MKEMRVEMQKELINKTKYNKTKMRKTVIFMTNKY